MSRQLYMTTVEHERIIKACSEDYVRTMRNWRIGSNGNCGVSAIDHTQVYVSGSAYDLPLPVLAGAVTDVDLALADERVALRWREAVRLFWTFEDRPLSFFCLRFGLSHKETAQQRIIRGNDEVARLLIQRRREADERRTAATRLASRA